MNFRRGVPLRGTFPFICLLSDAAHFRLLFMNLPAVDRHPIDLVLKAFVDRVFIIIPLLW